jgi:3-methyladenine DNA glycosylase AlkD
MAQRLADQLEAHLREIGTAERAAQEKRYLKSELAFHGATLPQIQRVVREAAGELADREAVVSLVEELWNVPVHERRMAAVLLLERYRRMLSVTDLPLVERLIRESRTWAYVDALAANVAGRIGQADDAAQLVFDRWATDPDFWVRRSALLSQLPIARDGGPLGRFFGYADAMLEEREFFIRKAIGWVLREAAKRRPSEVSRWLAPRTTRASGITMREATRYLPVAEAAELMTAYREQRTAADGG